MTTPAELPTGEALAAFLDAIEEQQPGFSDSHITAVLAHHELSTRDLDLWPDSLHVVLAFLSYACDAANQGEPAPLLALAAAGINELFYGYAERHSDHGMETNDDADIGALILESLRGSIDAEPGASGVPNVESRPRGRLCGLLRRFGAGGKGSGSADWA